MKIGVIKEALDSEQRVALLPAAAKKLIEKGAEIMIESGLADHLHIADEEYRIVGVSVADRTAILRQSEILIHVRPPLSADVQRMTEGVIHISFLDPFQKTDTLKSLADAGVTAISMEMIPRSTIAQKMDALSSQASLAGYYAVILAAERINKVLPMMTTPAGTITPASVFVIGAGVAGLQAIATAKRLGARVNAFDTRPAVEEQVKSLGAKFIQIDLGETGQTKDGYARQLTSQQLELQRQGMAKICAQSDIVITTAQVFGKTAPRILTAAMIRGMRPGSIIIDMAVESGGNVEGSVPGQEMELNGVRIIGLCNLPGRVALAASQMYANNVANLLLTFWDAETRTFQLNLADDILNHCIVTYKGKTRVSVRG